MRKTILGTIVLMVISGIAAGNEGYRLPGGRLAICPVPWEAWERTDLPDWQYTYEGSGWYCAQPIQNALLGTKAMWCKVSDRIGEVCSDDNMRTKCERVSKGLFKCDEAKTNAFLWSTWKIVDKRVGENKNPNTAWRSWIRFLIRA